MQKPSQERRRNILDAAAHLFAARPFHEVHLDEVASRARVGKGTIYVYFRDKDDLYLTLIREGFADMAAQAHADVARAGEDVWKRIAAVVAGLIRFATRFPDLFRILRSGRVSPDDPHLQKTRRTLSRLIEGILRDGVAQGKIDDPHPQITAQFILAFVRGAMLYPPRAMTPRVLERHVLRILRQGIERRAA